MVTFQRLVTWGLGPEPSTEAIAHELIVCRHDFFFFFLLIIYLSYTLELNFNIFLLGMTTMKENKGKEVVDEVIKPEAQSQLCPFVGDKGKTLSKMLDLENIPSR